MEAIKRFMRHKPASNFKNLILGYLIVSISNAPLAKIYNLSQ